MIEHIAATKSAGRSSDRRGDRLSSRSSGAARPRFVCVSVGPALPSRLSVSRVVSAISPAPVRPSPARADGTCASTPGDAARGDSSFDAGVLDSHRDVASGSSCWARIWPRSIEPSRPGDCAAQLFRQRLRGRPVDHDHRQLRRGRCDAYCAHLGQICSNSCTTNRGFGGYGVEAWPTAAECSNYVASMGQTSCSADLTAFTDPSAAKYRCCCH